MNRTATIATVAGLGACAAIVLTVIVRRIMTPAIDDETPDPEVAQLPDTEAVRRMVNDLTNYPEGWSERKRPQRQEEEKDNG